TRWSASQHGHLHAARSREGGRAATGAGRAAGSGRRAPAVEQLPVDLDGLFDPAGEAVLVDDVALGGLARAEHDGRRRAALAAEAPAACSAARPMPTNGSSAPVSTGGSTT